MRKFIQIMLDGDDYVAVADDGTVWRTVEWDASTHRVSWECISTTPQQEAKPTVTLLGPPVAVGLHDPDYALDEGQWVENGIVYRRQEVKP